jgi:hypothetical protein
MEDRHMEAFHSNITSRVTFLDLFVCIFTLLKNNHDKYSRIELHIATYINVRAGSPPSDLQPPSSSSEAIPAMLRCN